MQTNFLNPPFNARNLDIFLIRRSILSALIDHLNDFEGTLLDVGCGQMPYKSLLTTSPSRVNRYIGLDLENNPVYENHPDIIWQNRRIPLEDNVIHCAICTEVLEHCPEPESVLKEIHRVLKPGGLLFFTVPFLWPLHDVPHDEYRFTPFALQRHLGNSGFTNIDIKPMGGWDASMSQMIGLWVRRRPMSGWKRWILSVLVMPVIQLLLKKDNTSLTQFHESLMITGLYGVARKSENISDPKITIS